MKAYPDYAETSFPWLPQIPAHWALVRNKNIFQEVKDVVGDNAEAYPLLSLTTNGIILRDITSGKGKFPQDFNAYKVVKKGDMAFCLFDMDETPRTVGLSSYDGMLTGAYTIFHVDNINPHYAYYYYLSLDNVKALRPLYSGLRKTISAGAFLSIKLPVPPRDEQDRIVRFLDWKVSAMNRLIAIRNKEAAILEELKRSTINNALIRGLNPDAKRKDSGVTWVGDVPEHWSVTTIKRKCALIGSGATPDTENRSYYNGGVHWIQSGDLYHKSAIQRTEKTVTESAIRECGALSVYQPPFVVVAMYGASIGNVSVSYIPACVNQACCVLLPTDDMDIQFLYYWLCLCKTDFLSQAVGGTQPNISQRKIREEAIVVMPIEEQRQIVEYLDAKCLQINLAINCKCEQIQKLQELKTRLISDVVTGKMDVRDAAIPAYDGRGAEEREH